MSDALLHLRRIFRELKHRNVYRVAVTYLVVAFVALKVADVVFESKIDEGRESLKRLIGQ